MTEITNKESKTNSVISNEVAIYTHEDVSKELITEQFKAQVKTEPIKFPAEVGEQHPKGMDFAQLLDLYKDHNLCAAIVDKYCDYIVGGGFYVYSEDKKAEEVIKTYFEKINFDTILRPWVREALITGNGFIEIAEQEDIIAQLKPLTSKYMYVKRSIDGRGKIEGYTQYFGNTPGLNNLKKTMVDFKPKEIAHLKINCIGDEAYGMGIIHSNIRILNNILAAEKDQHMLLHRKANNPIHVKLGSYEKPVNANAVATFGKQLEWLNNKHEWVTDHQADMKVIDTGNISDKFVNVLEYDMEQIFYGFQIPAVLMGKANVAEGLANAQGETFERRIKSFQQEVEKVIEQQILRRVLESVGILDVHVEFEWNLPSQEDIDKKVATIKELLTNPMLSQRLRIAFEDELITLMELDMSKSEEEFNKQTPTPLQPPQEPEEPEKPEAPEKPEQPKEHIHEHYNNEGPTQEILLTEWVNKDYKDYLSYIIKRIKTDEFTNLAAENYLQYNAGYFSNEEVNKLRGILKNAFKEGWSINKIEKEIREKINPGDLLKVTEKGDRIELNEDGKAIVTAKAENRPANIARSESVRINSESFLDSLENSTIEKVEWLTASDERVCPNCAPMNGKIMTVDEARGQLPLHPSCRCLFLSVIGEKKEVDIKESLKKKLNEGWVTKDGRAIYIDDDGNAHYGADAGKAAQADKDKKSLKDTGNRAIDNVKKEIPDKIKNGVKTEFIPEQGEIISKKGNKVRKVQGTYNTKTNEIKIYSNANEGTIRHEFGHAAFNNNLNIEEKIEFGFLSKGTPKPKGHLAKQNIGEDFAESFRVYVEKGDLHPDRVKFLKKVLKK